MDDEVIEIYKGLYFRRGNNDIYFDYETHLELYRLYLLLFYDSELESHFYMDIEFLSYVVEGFSYFHDLFLGKSEIDDVELLGISLEQHSHLQDISSGSVERISVFDSIFAISWLSILELQKFGILEEKIDMSKQMLDNNCKINKVLSKKDIKGM